jgi:aryl-alcohol dehydrogenase-like predicted oxidoreductase
LIYDPLADQAVEGGAMVPVRSLGSSGLKVSNLCLGCLNFGGPTLEGDSLKILQSAYEAGIYFWDTADVYSNGLSEEIVGKAIRRLGERDRIVLATKVCGRTGPGPNDRGLSRHHITRAVEASLKRLRTDYIDLYQMHRPDEKTPVEETLETFDALVRAGKILHYGTSTFASWQMAEAEWTARASGFTRPISEQAPYNILDRRIENDRAGFLRKYGWGLLAWSPLAGGQLIGLYDQDYSSGSSNSRYQVDGTYRNRMNQESVRISRAYVALCKEFGLDPAQAAVAWLLHQDLVTAPIIGPRTQEHLLELIPAATLKLSTDFLTKIDELVPPGTAVADFLSPNVSWQIGHIPGIDKRFHSEEV